MHASASVILLTTLIGAGQGLFLALFAGQLYAPSGAAPGGTFYAGGAALAVALLIAGLGASFFHLGHPERAWRAAAQWRTSWLSREVIVLPLAIAAIGLYGALHYIGWNAATLPVGAVAALLALLLYLCTAMIYACLKFLQEWHSWLTVANFTLLGCASGFVLATALASLFAAGLEDYYLGGSVILILISCASRLSSLGRNRRLRPKSTLQSAIGVRHRRIVQMSQGATGGSFNTREFFHRHPRAVVNAARAAFLVLVFPLPLLLLLLSIALPSPLLPVLAFVLQFIGLLAERWYFFVDARHPQNLYYQHVS